MPSTILRARWIVPVTSPVIENGRVFVEDGRIAAVERARPVDGGGSDFGDAVIVPGFVNAHTHLELTICHGRVPFEGAFVGWLERLVSSYPRGVAAAETALRESIREGFRRSLAAGVTAVADIGYGRRAVEEWRQAPVNVVGLLEVLGVGHKALADHELSIARVTSICREADGAYQDAARAPRDIGTGPARGSLLRLGISPHAPYSTDPSVYRAAIEFITRGPRPISTHLAETRDELQFLRDGTGPFREFLERRGLWDGSFTPPACSPVQYAAQLGLLACKSLLVHVNYATDDDLDLLARARGRATVVYCPRSHAFFKHEPHRYPDMLARGINVCIGTDSLASNDSLSVLDELRFLRRRDGQLGAARLLEMGTIAGARALGLDAELGSLEVGKRADLAVLPLTDPAADPLDHLLSADARPMAVYVRGQRLVKSECPV